MPIVRPGGRARRAALVAATVAIGAAGVAALGLATAAATGRPVLDARRALLFQQTCARCHVRPGSGAPLVGDAPAWEARRAQGAGRLLANTVDGLRGMPPLGTCGACSEADLRALVAFVAGLAPDGESP